MAADATTYVLFELAGTAYAIPSSDVQRMEMVEEITPVPNAPAYVEGGVITRGKVVPAVNLRMRFGFERAEFTLATRLIVVAQGSRLVGLIVDSAREFVKISAEAIQPPPEALAGTSGRYVRGVASATDRLILILDVAGVVDAAA
ncbi:MAG: chemotaxis protein CheW [Gemmataceae bacterium]|nr:chemotaxis protein CheW [Gemmataceae bacterium]